MSRNPPPTQPTNDGYDRGGLNRTRKTHSAHFDQRKRTTIVNFQTSPDSNDNPNKRNFPEPGRETSPCRGRANNSGEDNRDRGAKATAARSSEIPDQPKPKSLPLLCETRHIPSKQTEGEMERELNPAPNSPKTKSHGQIQDEKLHNQGNPTTAKLPRKHSVEWNRLQLLSHHTFADELL